MGTSKISHKLSVEMAESDYEKFNQTQINTTESDFNKVTKKIQDIKPSGNKSER